MRSAGRRLVGANPMNPKTRAVMMSSASDDWGTPQVIVDAVKRYAPIGLDPCGGPNSVVKAKCTIKPPQDGIHVKWKVLPTEIVFVNPPFGPRGAWVPLWIEKAIQAQDDEGTESILLVTARTDTRWFHRLFTKGLMICFVKGRLHFRVGNARTGPAPFPSSVALLPGEYISRERLESQRRKFTDVFSPFGKVVSL